MTVTSEETKQPYTSPVQERPEEPEIDLGLLWQGVRRRLPIIFLASLLIGGGAYFWAKSQPKVYEASATLLAINTSAQQPEGFLTGLGSAPPLPDGVVAKVVRSPQVLGVVIQELQASSSLEVQERTRLVNALRDELRLQNLKTLTLSSDIQPYNGGNGTYTLTAHAQTPQAAQLLANLTSRALLNWDRRRALASLRRSQAGFQAQLTQIDEQLRTATGQEREALVARQATIQSNLLQASLLQDSVTGVLSSLTAAVEPGAPIAPRPLRQSAIAALITAVLGLLYSVVRTLLDRTVRSEDDVLNLGLPIFASVPRLGKRDVMLSGIVRAGRSGGLYESMGFLRVNLLGALGRAPHPIVMITSTLPGEGKSSVTASLADGFASNGQRVLIVDLDLRRGTQGEVWNKYNQESDWVQLSGQGGARTTQAALLDPYNVQVVRAEANVDMLPAGPGVTDSMRLLSRASLEEALTLWKQDYDVVLVDTPPLLALADGLVIGKYANGVLVVVENGKTTVPALNAALGRAKQSNLHVLGAVVNKVNISSTYNPGGYAYAPRR